MPELFGILPTQLESGGPFAHCRRSGRRGV